MVVESGFKQFLIKLVLFLGLFIVLSGLIGPWVISTRLLYHFGFFIYGGLGKVTLFGSIVFVLLSRQKLRLVKKYSYNRLNLLALMGAFLLIPSFFEVGRRLLQYSDWSTNIGLTLVAHLLIIVMIILLIIGSLGANLITGFLSKLQRELLISTGLSLIFYFSFNLIFQLWPLLSGIVLTIVQFILNLNFSPVGFIPPRTLVLSHFAVEVGQTCSGIESLFLFSALYILIACLDWPKFNHKKIILVFFPVLVGLFLVNILRVYLIIIIGQLISPYIAGQLFHTYAGMILFIIYFIAFWQLFYKRLLK